MTKRAAAEAPTGGETAPTVLRLLHDKHFDLFAPEDAPKGESLGTYTVLGRDGEEEREKFLVNDPGNDTTVELPADFDVNNLQAVTHLIEVLTDRHSPDVTGVTAVSGDPVFAKRIAALLGVEVVK